MQSKKKGCRRKRLSYLFLGFLEQTTSGVKSQYANVPKMKKSSKSDPKVCLPYNTYIVVVYLYSCCLQKQETSKQEPSLQTPTCGSPQQSPHTTPSSIHVTAKRTSSEMMNNSKKKSKSKQDVRRQTTRSEEDVEPKVSSSTFPHLPPCTIYITLSDIRQSSTNLLHRSNYRTERTLPEVCQSKFHPSLTPSIPHPHPNT